jgi:hypothetical protein
MKLIICFFEQLSGLKINFHKSKIYCFGKAKKVESDSETSLDINWALYLSNILASLFIIENC